MASDTITIDRALFDDLVECAVDCEAHTRWRRADSRYLKDWEKRLPDILARAVAIRDAPPQCMTDAEREIWTEAGLFEVQLQAAAQRLREALGNLDIGSLDVVEAVDELIAKNAKAIADMREAQGTIVEHIRTSDWHVMIDAWQSGTGKMYFSVDDANDKSRGATREVDSSRCLLAQIAEAIDEWKRINLPAGGKSE